MAKRYRHDKERSKLTKLSKICPKCGIEKNGIEFGFQYPGKNDHVLRSWCKSCCKERTKEYRKTNGGKEKHREYMREYMRKYRETH